MTPDEQTAFIQHAISKYENEEDLLKRLATILDEKTIQRTIDMLIGTQRVRRIGPEILQNNTSHTEVPPLPEHLRSTLDDL